MEKLGLATQRNTAARTPGLDASYRPALDARAKGLIARIQKNHLDTQAVLELEAHYEAHGDYPSLANLMEGWARTLRDDRGAAAAYVKAAEAVLLSLGDRSRAQTLLQRALGRYPEDERALERLEPLLRELGDHTGLERCYAQLATQLASRNAKCGLRASVHFKLGQLYEERLMLRGRAIAQYRSAVELDPSFVPAIAAARGIYLNSGKMEAAADMFELQIAATAEATSRHALLVELARHRRDALGDLEGAVHALRRAVKLLPAEPPALESLAQLLVERAATGAQPESDRSRAAELYYQAARSVPRKQALVRLHACLELRPDHPRARRMWAELTAYGARPAPERGIAESRMPQAEVDRRATGVYGGAPVAPGQTLPGPVRLLARARGDCDAEDEMLAWLDDAEVELIEDGVTAQNMVPLSDRPPPPDADPRPARNKPN